jgi:acetylornithine/N-succinyldiaminopimelate aminotransferase
VENSFADSVFCCNSGTEAVEAAIKFIRRYHRETGSTDRYRIITIQGGFHGRTLAALSAGSSAAVEQGYGPLLDGFARIPFNDIAALRGAITEHTAAIMFEPIQGEGGVRPHSQEFVHAARQLCDEHGLLLFLDEVQCGTGRPGTLFAYEQYGVVPDICTIGKGIGNGFPLAACLVIQKIADVMTPGCHGSTYGSNPLAMSVGNAVLDVLLEPGFLSHVVMMGEALKLALEQLQTEYPTEIKQVRGRGLILGIETAQPAHDFATKLREAGLLVAPAGNSVLRILPPLIIEHSHIEQAIILFRKVLS